MRDEQPARAAGTHAGSGSGLTAWAPAVGLAAAIVVCGYSAVGHVGASASPSAGAAAASPAAAREDTHKLFGQLRAAVLVGPDGSALTRGLAGEHLQYLLDRFASLEAGLPRETFDPKSVVDSVGRDPKALLEWVRDRTFWAPYRGALRGPVGVLMDRVGSSLDRSLLLAELLRLAGHSARLAHAELTPDQTGALRERLKPVPAAPVRLPQAASAWSAGPDRVLAEYAQRFHNQPSALVQTFARLRQTGESEATDARRQSGAHAAQVRSALGNPQGKESAGDDTAALADHWWVQYSQNGQWIDCDVTPRDAEAGQTTAAARSTFAPGGLPEGDRWTIDVRVVIERLSSNRLTEQIVLNRRLSTLEVSEQDVTLGHAPLNFPKGIEIRNDPAGRFRSAILGVNEWVPLLMVGNRRQAGSNFRNAGGLSARPGQGAPINPGALSGGLAGAEDQDSTGELTAEWIDYEIRGPGSQTRRIRRELFDLVGPAARASRQFAAFSVDEAGRMRRALALLGETAILIQVAQPSPEFLAHRLLKRFRENRNQLLALASPDRPVSERDANALLGRLAPRSDTLWRYAAVRFENNQSGGEVYLDGPSIATLHSTVALPAGERPVRRQRFDIVSNRVAVRKGSNTSAVMVRIDQGVADTTAEQVVLPEPSDGGSTTDIFVAAAEQGVGPVVVRNDGAAWRGPTDLPADVLARVRTDISEGHDVVIPGRMVTLAGAPRIGWWRVDRSDGTLVGVMDTGFHQGLVEYVKDAAAAVVASIVGDWIWDHLDEGRLNLHYSLIITSNVLLMISDWLRDHPVKQPGQSSPT